MPTLEAEPSAVPQTPSEGHRADPSLARRWSERIDDDTRRSDALLADLRAGRDGGRPRPPADRDLREIRWAGEDLHGLNLSGVDLEGADLTGCDLSGARLVGARLCNAMLHGADLTGCEFLNADLTGADLTECKAEGAGFGGADLTRTTLFHAQLQNATLTQARLVHADLKTASLRGARLRQADLTDCDLTRADLTGAGIEKSRLDRAIFVHAVLRGAGFRGVIGFQSAQWIGADIHDANFCGAYMARRSIMDQNYLHEFRQQSRFNAVLYRVWWLTSDCGRSFLRWWLWTAVVMLAFAGAFEFVAVDYGDHRTFLSSIYYSVITLTTLGYGDVLPASAAAQLLAMLEVIIGYVMLGGLLSIFSNKMARRAD